MTTKGALWYQNVEFSYFYKIIEINLFSMNQKRCELVQTNFMNVNQFY